MSIDESGPSQWGSHSLASHTLRREEGYGHRVVPTAET